MYNYFNVRSATYPYELLGEFYGFNGLLYTPSEFISAYGLQVARRIDANDPGDLRAACVTWSQRTECKGCRMVAIKAQLAPQLMTVQQYTRVASMQHMRIQFADHVKSVIVDTTGSKSKPEQFTNTPIGGQSLEDLYGVRP